jgi:hypothetical protein
MARGKSAVAAEGIPNEEASVSTPFVAADNPRKALSARATWTARELSALGRQQLYPMHPFRGGCLLGELCQESRGVAAESTKFRDSKGNEADV